MRMSDGPQGLGTNGKSTAYPATVMLAATWNENLAYQYGQSLGRDCRARGVNIILGLQSTFIVLRCVGETLSIWAKILI